jgi:hypothetical protein
VTHMLSLSEAAIQVREFKGVSLRARISALEQKLQHTNTGSLPVLYETFGIAPSLLSAALLLKRELSQINEVVHAAGILLAVPHIIRDDEIVQYLSLGAGNVGRPFDLETNLRIAEFKFIDWKGGAESIRQNQLFKDFYYLAEYDTDKERYLYVLGTTHPLHFFNGGRALRSVMSKQPSLHVVDLAQVIPEFAYAATLNVIEPEQESSRDL